MDLSDFDDAELLELIADRSDKEVWQQASVAFFDRHIRWLYALCRKKRYRISGGDAEGFARDVFVSIIESKAATFSRRENLSSEDVQACVRAWIGRIAENRITDQYRQRHEIREQSNTDWEFESFHHRKLEVEVVSDDVVAATQHLAGLDDRERAIVMEYLKWDEQGRRIPSVILQGMAEEFEMTSEGVRKVYYRFRQSVKAEMEANRTPQPVGKQA